MTVTTLKLTNNGPFTVNWKGTGYEINIPPFGVEITASIPAENATEEVEALLRQNPEVSVQVVGSFEGEPTDDGEGYYIPLLLYASKYKGTWDASGEEAPAESPEKGDYWLVSVSGDYELSGISTWEAGQYVQWVGDKWMKIINHSADIEVIDGGELS